MKWHLGSRTSLTWYSLSGRTATSWPALMYLVHLRYQYQYGILSLRPAMFLWFVYIAIALQCNACGMYVILFFCSCWSGPRISLLSSVRFLVSIAWGSSSGSTLHRAQSAQITPVISQEWKGLKHAIVHSFHHFALVYFCLRSRPVDPDVVCPLVSQSVAYVEKMMTKIW